MHSTRILGRTGDRGLLPHVAAMRAHKVQFLDLKSADERQRGEKSTDHASLGSTLLRLEEDGLLLAAFGAHLVDTR